MEYGVRFSQPPPSFAHIKACGCLILMLGNNEQNTVIACPKHREAVIKATEGE